MTQPAPDAIAVRAGVFDGALLRDVLPLREAVPGLAPDLLLHAGPPLPAGSRPPAPVRNAAMQALVHDGAAPDLAAAADLLESGAWRLAPAQDHGVVTPLAQVVSPHMPVLVVGEGARRRCAPIAEGPPPALRFGSPDVGCVQAMREHARAAATALGPWLRRHPLALAPVIAAALAAGDDCHSRTAEANRELVARLDGLEAAYRARIEANPGFVLTVLMAASAWVLAREAADGEIVAVGGNGRDFGLRLAGEAGWRCAPASPPVGTRLPARPEAPVLGAIGDSAVIDFCGLGGQALDCAPALAEEWAAQLPTDWAGRPAALVDDAGLVSASRVAAHGMAPIVHLAMVAADAQGGLLGRGFYLPPVELFAHTAFPETTP